MAVTSMIGLVYSKYWLMQTLSPETYLAWRHGKYTLAACGHCIRMQFGLSPNVFGVIGKVGAFAGLALYGYGRLMDEHSQLKHGAVSNGVGHM